MVLLDEERGGERGQCRNSRVSMLIFDFQAGYPWDPSKDCKQIVSMIGVLAGRVSFGNCPVLSGPRIRCWAGQSGTWLVLISATSSHFLDSIALTARLGTLYVERRQQVMNNHGSGSGVANATWNDSCATVSDGRHRRIPNCHSRPYSRIHAYSLWKRQKASRLKLRVSTHTSENEEHDI
jgi:hypothetical protein